MTPLSCHEIPVLLPKTKLGFTLPSIMRESMHHIRHLDVLTLDLPRTNYRTVGDRAFKVAAPTLWNVLPIELRIIKDVVTR